MSKLLILLFLNSSLFAQTSSVVNEDNSTIENPSYVYVSLAENKVYDVEIIVFAYKNELPNDKTYLNKAIFDDSQALSLDVKPEETPEIENLMFEVPDADSIDTEKTNNTQSNKDEYTIPLEETDDNKRVLVWFEHPKDEMQLTPLWERLVKNSTIVPLIHKAWRQPETPFDNPTYVKLNNTIVEEKDEYLESSNEPINTLAEPSLEIIKNTAVLNSMTLDANGTFVSESEDDLHENRYADFSLTGMVALSQGRFMHFGHKLNLFRTYNNEENIIKNMVFSLTERKQLDTDALNYFDSPWFGSIVKITEYTGEQEDEIKDDNSEE